MATIGLLLIEKILKNLPARPFTMDNTDKAERQLAEVEMREALIQELTAEGDLKNGGTV